MVASARVSAPPEDRPQHQLVAVLACASLLVAMLFNLVIPLIPVLPSELGSSPSNTAWVATAFFLTGAVANPVGGRLADMFGNRRVFLICIWLLIAGSLVCALATNLTALLAGRVLQGMALPMMSISLSIMRHQLVLHRLPAAVGWASAAMGIGNGIGLLGGGYLIDTFSWHAVFWATACVAAPLALVAPLVVPNDTIRLRQRLDVPGTLGLIAILVCLLLPLSKLAEWGVSWGSLALIALAIVMIPWWSRGRLHRDSPVVDLASLRSRATTATHLTAVTAGFCGFMGFVVTTYVLQAPGPDGFDLSLTQAGLCMAPASMSFLAIGPITSQMVLRLGMRRVLMIGCATMAAGALGMAFWSDGLGTLLSFLVVVFIGNGILMSALPVATAAYSAPEDIGSTNGVNALARTTGIAFASGVFALVLGLHRTQEVSVVPTWNQLVSATIALSTVALCALAIPRRRHAPPTSIPATITSPPGQ